MLSNYEFKKLIDSLLTKDEFDKAINKLIIEIRKSQKNREASASHDIIFYPPLGSPQFSWVINAANSGIFRSFLKIPKKTGPEKRRVVSMI